MVLRLAGKPPVFKCSTAAQDRTILFDLLPLRTIAFPSYELQFQVIAIPGQRLYAATRKMLLKGADTIVFVANSAADRFQENLAPARSCPRLLTSATN